VTSDRDEAAAVKLSYRTPRRRCVLPYAMLHTTMA